VASGHVTAHRAGTAFVVATSADGGHAAMCRVDVGVPATGIYMAQSSISLSVGASRAIEASVLPMDAANKLISWSSSGPGVASVSGGLVTGVAPGTAVIVATTQQGGFSAYCVVQVGAAQGSAPAPSPAAVESIFLSHSSKGLGTASGSGEFLLSATVLPSGAPNKNVAWASSDPGVAMVVGSGLDAIVVVVGPGSATITAVTEDQGKSAHCDVYVWPGDYVPVESVSVHPASATLGAGPGGIVSLDFAAAVVPMNASDAGVSWSSSDPGVAIVGPTGAVTSVSPGHATITATARDGGASAQSQITVVPGAWEPDGGEPGEGEPGGLRLNASSRTMVPNSTFQLMASAPGAPGARVAWASSAPAIAEVGPFGLVTAKKSGSATIAAATEDGSMTATCAITVKAGSTTESASVSAGGSHTAALRADGRLYAWGLNGSGQLGDGSNASKSSPTQVGTLTDWAAISAGGSHTAALRSGSLYAWGLNGSGQLGDGTATNRNAPTRVGTATDWASVSAGGSHTLALKADGTLWAWGGNAGGQLGDGANTNRSAPVQVGAASNWASVSAGGSHTAAVRADGRLYAWGFNDYGQVGDGTNMDRNAPVQVGSARDWAAVSAGGSHTAALRQDGTLWAWGDNYSGQLGDGTRTDRSAPAQVGKSSDWASVSAGGSHTLAIRQDGTLWAWGGNAHGQLGIGGTANPDSPVQVGSDKDWASVSAGDSHTAALKLDGRVFVWGRNNHGQLGNGTAADSSSPIGAGPGAVRVTGVALDKATLNLNMTSNQSLAATVFPSNATTRAVTWSSSDEAVATVGSNGAVSPKGAGSAVVTVRTADGGFTAVCQVTVTVVPVQGISLSPATLSLWQGEYNHVSVAFAPSDSTSAVTWTSSAPSIAEVDQSGKVTAVKAGSATITAQSADGGHTATCAVTVNAFTGIELTPGSLNLMLGTWYVGFQLSAKLLPSDAALNGGAWTSSDPSVAEVDQSGKVTAVKAGSAAITVEYAGFTATCQVNVLQASGTVTIDRTSGGATLNGECVIDPHPGAPAGEKSMQLEATLQYPTATGTMVWESSDPSIAAVDQFGLVTAVKAGSATISAYMSDSPTQKGTYPVTVMVLARSVTGVLGSVYIDPIELDQLNKSRSFTVTVGPEEATDKSLSIECDEPNLVCSVSGNLVTIEHIGVMSIGNDKTITVRLRTNGGNVEVPIYVACHW
jgi:uncharacterized protein YjdB